MIDQLPYLVRLTMRLGDGFRRLPADWLAPHVNFVAGKQQADGGFPGREGGSDLYYTAFALRTLAAADGLTEAAALAANRYLAGQASSAESIVDLVSWLSAAASVVAAGFESIVPTDDAWANNIATWMESFRGADGGYAKGHGGAAGSTYHTFLALCCGELLGLRPADVERTVGFLKGQRRGDGGYVELAPMTSSGANPTAAAAASLLMLDSLPADEREPIADFLGELLSDEGGVRANARIPFADGLSTFTGLLTAFDLGLPAALPLPGVLAFVDSLALPGGGFGGAVWDRVADVEYTFYALGCRALLAGS